jgi:tetratricopeptide (TPR) repeat protein
MMKHIKVLLLVICSLLFTDYYLLRAEQSDEEVQALNAFKNAMRSDENINVAEFALIIAGSIYPDINQKDYLHKIDQMADEIKKNLGNANPPDRTSRAGEPEKIIQAINNYFRQKKVVAESVTKEVIIANFMLNKVVDSVKGNCLGLSTLYWSLAERLNLPLQAIVIPQHVFLIYDNGRNSRFIEATSRGAEVSREEYIKKTRSLVGDTIPRYNIGDEIKFRHVSKQQFIGLMLYNRGVYYLKKSKNSDALSDFNWTLILDPENNEAYKNRGGIYLQQGKFSEARDDFKKVLELQSDAPANYFNLGQALSNLNQIDDAIKNYDQALRMAPDYADVYHNRGLAYAKQNLLDKALGDLEHAISLDPKNGSFYYNRAIIYEKMGNTDKAIADYSKSIEFNSLYPEIYNNRGILYAKQEKWSEAIADFQKSIELVPNFPDPYQNLAVIYYKTQKYDLSLKYVNKYLELIPVEHPNRKQIEEMLKDLQQRLK